MASTLEMNFMTELGGRFKISLPDPRTDLTAAEVETAMNTIIGENIFSSATGNLSGIHSAQVVTRNVEELIAPDV